VFIPTLLAILLGSTQVEKFINAVPDTIIDGLGVAGDLLPAIGFALLLDMLFSRKMSVFFFSGFLVASYFEIDITAVALIGACVAIIIYIVLDNKGKEDNGSNTNDN